MPVVQSRVNGIKINIPADAAGVVGRYASKGDNELIFEKPRTKAPKDEEPTVVESIEPDKKSNKKPDSESEFA